MMIPHYDSDVHPQVLVDLDKLATLTMQIVDLEDEMATVVESLRERSISWLMIGEQLGITAQGAHKRYSK